MCMCTCASGSQVQNKKPPPPSQPASLRGGLRWRWGLFVLVSWSGAFGRCASCVQVARHRAVVHSASSSVGLAGPGAGGASSNTNGEMDMPMFLEVVWRSRLSLKRAELLGTFVLIFFLGGCCGPGRSTVPIVPLRIRWLIFGAFVCLSETFVPYFSSPHPPLES